MAWKAHILSLFVGVCAAKVYQDLAKKKTYVDFKGHVIDEQNPSGVSSFCVGLRQLYVTHRPCRLPFGQKTGA